MLKLLVGPFTGAMGASGTVTRIISQADDARKGQGTPGAFTHMCATRACEGVTSDTSPKPRGVVDRTRDDRSPSA